METDIYHISPETSGTVRATSFPLYPSFTPESFTSPSPAAIPGPALTTTVDVQAAPVSLRHLPTGQRKDEAEKKYAKAVSLYASTNLTIREIAKITGFTPAALSAHLRRNHRSLTLRRYPLPTPENQSSRKTLPSSTQNPIPSTISQPIKSPKGQSLVTRLKYQEAIDACADPAYIELNVSEIAHMFHLNPTALANQLKYHFPDVLAHRDKSRAELGLALNRQRGVKPESIEAYDEALRLYRDTGLTLVEVARRCNVSLGGFGQFLRFYHKDLIHAKALRRAASTRSATTSPKPTPGSAPPSILNQSTTLNSKPQTPAPKPRRSDAKYKEAIAEYLSSDKPMKEIAARRGLVYKSLMSYLKRHNITRKPPKSVKIDDKSQIIS